MELLDKAKEKIKTTRFRSDKVIWILVMIFAMISVLAIYSSSSSLAVPDKVNKLKYFKTQLMFAGGGLAALFFCYYIPLKWYRRLALLIYIGSIALMAYALIAGESVNGAQRTIKLVGVSFQPLEIGKIGLVFYLAKALELWKDSLNTFKDFCFKLLLPIAVTCGLALPNSASSVFLFGGVGLLILFLMNVNWRYIVITILTALALLAIMIGIYDLKYKGVTIPKKEDRTLVDQLFNRFGTSQERIENFIRFDIKEEKVDPKVVGREAYNEHLDDIRQSQNAKVAILEGKLFGKGPGKGTSRYCMSEAFSDLIYAFIINEYGLLGGVSLIFLYLLFLFRGIRISQNCGTVFPQALALGITWLIAAQAMFHIFVNVRLLPITGHTLPFISQGGTSFMIFCGAVGVLLSISKQINKQNEDNTTANEEEKSIEENEKFESDN